MARPDKRRPGDWLSTDHEAIRKWIENLKAKAAGTDPGSYIQPIKDLQQVVARNGLLTAATEAMFVEAIAYARDQPTGAPAVTSWDEFLKLLNAVMTTSPEFMVDKGSDEAQGLVGFPINALLDWPMGTAAGVTVFQDAEFNAAFKKVLTHWGQFLTTEPSRYVLAEGDPSSDPPTIAWLSEPARKQMIAVAQQPFSDPPKDQTLENIFAVPDPSDTAYLGYTSWDDFFTRVFKEGQRPVGDAPVVNACESAPLQVKTGVELEDNIWAKGQPYSLTDMLNGDPLAQEFAGGTVYQAFLSALSYHRWHSPVDGTIEKVVNVDGSYYLESPWEGIYSDDPDPSAPNASQPFITSVATRAIIFIRAADPAIGLMAMVPVGMAEVSSCEVTVTAGDSVKRGDPVGMFHFGGSTHCLVFRPGVELDFHVPVTDAPNLNATNVAVRSDLASLKGS
ncbi:phosphatidylserine decarboxylase family protein [Amorphus orientalis]|uniref:Phosphatidylserine decarboxylase n=1 Tax=Amorphus orientalis TaxID=649198 RepID=A0AAE4ARA1_9HYPH|nr:phosphatidylserine decarboxylase family protein [Amorphus orientalis]MDQ0313977.1 phosphatidylserine decarboxylase [Amorphus orientalis]